MIEFFAAAHDRKSPHQATSLPIIPKPQYALRDEMLANDAANCEFTKMMRRRSGFKTPSTSGKYKTSMN